MKSSPTLGTSNNYVVSTHRKDFKVFLHIPDALVGCTDVIFFLNNVMGDSAFSQKTKSTSGATVGGIVDGVFWYTKHVHYTLVWI
jgi:hypothetical protein